MKQPPSRSARARTAANDPRRLCEESPTVEARAALAAKATYVPYAKHKRHPQAYGLKPYAGRHEDPTLCDEHAGFKPGDMTTIGSLLQRGIAAGLFCKTRKLDGDPGLIWTVDDKGWIYEAQLSSPGHGLYHGYPVLPKRGHR